MWPLYVVLGVIVTAAIISIAYVEWLRRYGGYTKLEMPADKLTIFKSISPMTSSEISTGGLSRTGEGDTSELEETEECTLGAPEALLVIYQSTAHVSPIDLDMKVIERLKSEYPDHSIYPISIPIEPGYNAFRIKDKQLNWLRNATTTWKTSIFHAAIMPIEIFIRWTFLPTWMMIDFVDHLGKFYAALLIPNQAIEDGLIYKMPDIKFLEGYDGLYVSAPALTDRA